MNKTLFLIGLAGITLMSAICAARSQSMSFTNTLFNPTATIGFGKNLQTHKTIEFGNITLPINQTLSASIVAARFGANHTPAYGGGTLNAGFDWNAPLIGQIRPSLGSGALYSQKTFTSYTELNVDKTFKITKHVGVGFGGGIGYMPSAQGFDALLGITLHGSF